jgi:hypothetical protein
MARDCKTAEEAEQEIQAYLESLWEHTKVMRYQIVKPVSDSWDD